MRIVLALLLALACTCAQAQSCQPDPANNHGWCNSVVGLSALQLTANGSEVVTVQFASAAAVTGVSLDVEIFDPAGVRVPGGQSWVTGVAFAASQSVQATPLVWTIPAGQPPGTYTIKLGAFLADNTLAYWNDAAATLTVTAAISGVPCAPKVQWPLAVKRGDIPASVSTTNSKYAVYVCNMANGYQTVYLVFNYSDIAAYIEPYIDGLLSLAQINAISAPLQTPLTASEAAFIAPIVQANRPKATVGYSALSATRAVYTLTAAGTASAAVAGESVATAKPCNESDRIPGTAFYSVAGQSNAAKAGTTLPKGSYSSCTITFSAQPN